MHGATSGSVFRKRASFLPVGAAGGLWRLEREWNGELEAAVNWNGWA